MQMNPIADNDLMPIVQMQQQSMQSQHSSAPPDNEEPQYLKQPERTRKETLGILLNKITWHSQNFKDIISQEQRASRSLGSKWLCKQNDGLGDQGTTQQRSAKSF
jgi:hypothetical protein